MFLSPSASAFRLFRCRCLFRFSLSADYLRRSPFSLLITPFTLITPAAIIFRVAAYFAAMLMIFHFRLHIA